MYRNSLTAGMEVYFPAHRHEWENATENINESRAIVLDTDTWHRTPMGKWTVIPGGRHVRIKVRGHERFVLAQQLRGPYQETADERREVQRQRRQAQSDVAAARAARRAEVEKVIDRAKDLGLTTVVRSEAYLDSQLVGIEARELLDLLAEVADWRGR
jgi:hypothetical protein